MKIDIHTHTRKCKSGDAPTREISPTDFCEKVLATEVRIVAITNHNAFDLAQFEAIQAGLDGEAQVWPGIELDVIDEGARGHLIVIVSPALVQEFAGVVDELTETATPDSFTTTIDEVLECFDSLEPLYVAHYGRKRPDLSDEALEVLASKAHSSDCVIKEVTNSISAGFTSLMVMHRSTVLMCMIGIPTENSRRAARPSSPCRQFRAFLPSAQKRSDHD